MDKSKSLRDAVATLRDGMVIGVGGWGARRKPMALIREILRSDVKDLTVVAFGGPEVGLLAASGKLKKLIFGFVSLDMIPLEPYFRKAREAGKLEVMELDEGMVYTGLMAAAWRLPFIPTRCGIGSDVMKNNPDLKLIRSPYADAETMIAMPALNLDMALLHAERADKWGNTITGGPDPYFDAWMARAAKQCIVTCDTLEDRLALTRDEAKNNLFERSFVTTVVHAPFGAHPTSCPDLYGWDMDHLKTYTASAAEEGGWEKYRAEYLSLEGDAYIEKVGGADRLRKLRLPVM